MCFRFRVVVATHRCLSYTFMGHRRGGQNGTNGPITIWFKKLLFSRITFPTHKIQHAHRKTMERVFPEIVGI